MSSSSGPAARGSSGQSASRGARCQGKRPYFTAEWNDPQTGRKRRESTGEKSRREAERYAARLEDMINSGQYGAIRVLWKDFRELYIGYHFRSEEELEKLRALALKKGMGKRRTKVKNRWTASTKARVETALNAIERILKPKFLSSVNDAAIVKLTNELLDSGRSPAGVASCLRHVKAALRWANRKRLLSNMPDIEMPEGANVSGGRAVTAEEFDRMLQTVPKVVRERDVESWRHLLECLWFTGLRLGEAMKLSWTDDKDLLIDLEGKYPKFHIRALASKNGKDQRFPMSPEAAEFLLRTPKFYRYQFATNPSFNGRRAKLAEASRIVATIGEMAKIFVARTPDGYPIFATAHDLRRSFATRWAAKVTPSVLQGLMRHASPATTAKFYSDLGGDPIAEAVWQASGKDVPKMSESAAKLTITEPSPALPVSSDRLEGTDVSHYDSQSSVDSSTSRARSSVG